MSSFMSQSFIKLKKKCKNWFWASRYCVINVHCRWGQVKVHICEARWQAGWLPHYCHFCSLGVAPVIVRVKLSENSAISFPSLHTRPDLSLSVRENCPAVSVLQGLMIPALIFPECFICFLVFFACFHELPLSPVFSHTAVPLGPHSFCFHPYCLRSIYYPFLSVSSLVFFSASVLPLASTLFETEPWYAAQAGLKLTMPISAFQVLGL